MTTGIADVEWLDAKVCELSAQNERLRAALKPFATAAECAYRGAGDAAAGLGLWMPLKFLDAAKDALAFTGEQSQERKP